MVQLHFFFISQFVLCHPNVKTIWKKTKIAWHWIAATGGQGTHQSCGLIEDTYICHVCWCKALTFCNVLIFFYKSNVLISSGNISTCLIWPQLSMLGFWSFMLARPLQVQSSDIVSELEKKWCGKDTCFWEGGARTGKSDAIMSCLKTQSTDELIVQHSWTLE